MAAFTLTHPLDAALVDDARVSHGVTPVQALDASAPAYRDVLVVTFKRRAKRRIGRMSNPVEIYDTTLRDGSQGQGVSFSVLDKLRIAERLDAFGVHYIEGGWPGSNPKDIEFFDEAKRRKLRTPSSPRSARPGARASRRTTTIRCACCSTRKRRS